MIQVTSAQFAVAVFWMLGTHALCDFALQSEAMARGKNRHYQSQPPPGQKPQVNWYYWLSAHALIHGAAIGLVSGVPFFGAVITLTHWLFDFAKCEGWTTIHLDQLLHIAPLLVVAAAMAESTALGL